MKSRYLFAAFVVICSLFGALACSLTQDQRSTLRANLIKDGKAAVVGGLTTGTWSGAAAGAGAQVVKNHTSAKQPVGKVQPLK